MLLASYRLVGERYGTLSIGLQAFKDVRSGGVLPSGGPVVRFGTSIFDCRSLTGFGRSNSPDTPYVALSKLIGFGGLVAILNNAASGVNGFCTSGDFVYFPSAYSRNLTSREALTWRIDP